MQLDGDWSFVPQSAWSLAVQTEHAPSDDVQAMLGTSYPFTAAISGDVERQRDQRAAGAGWQFRFWRIFKPKGCTSTGWAANCISRAMRSGCRTRSCGAIPGAWRGTCFIVRKEENIEFNLTGAGIQLDKIQALQNPSLALAGRLDFALRGSGPVRAPAGKGDFHVLGLKIGTDEEGDFHGQLDSDGHACSRGAGFAGLAWTIAGASSAWDYRATRIFPGNFRWCSSIWIRCLRPGLHLKNLTGHSVVDGNFTLAGALRKPDSIEVNADISQISLNYLFVSLQNDGPLQFTYHRNEIRIAQAHLRGPDSNFQISGSARFDRERPVHVSVTGAVNLGVAERNDAGPARDGGSERQRGD